MDDKPKEDKTTIDPKEAVRVAVRYYKEVAEKIMVSKLRLEEIELLRAEGEWRVTLSHPEVSNDLIFGYGDKREYKIFTIDAHSGDVKAMKIRQI